MKIVGVPYIQVCLVVRAKNTETCKHIRLSRQLAPEKNWVTASWLEIPNLAFYMYLLHSTGLLDEYHSTITLEGYGLEETRRWFIITDTLT